MSYYKPPDDLVFLARCIIRTFYNFELYLVVDMLLHYPCIKEDQLSNILKLDSRRINSCLKQLKSQMFISEKLLKDEKYYFINFPLMVNAIKYRIHKIAHYIEIKAQEKIEYNIYRCDKCHSIYSDSDMATLISRSMKCFRCNEGKVDKDDSLLSNAVSRVSLADFNTQTKTILDLLQKVEKIQLAPHILSPAPADYSYVIDGGNKTTAETVETVVNLTMDWSDETSSQTFDSIESAIFIKSKPEVENNNNLDLYIIVEQQPIAIEKITPELISKMSKEEKKFYINKVSELYNAAFEI